MLRLTMYAVLVSLLAAGQRGGYLCNFPGRRKPKATSRAVGADFLDVTVYSCCHRIM